eukprot:6212943-Pleurochrysis_carterae.AAC.2
MPLLVTEPWTEPWPDETRRSNPTSCAAQQKTGLLAHKVDVGLLPALRRGIHGETSDTAHAEESPVHSAHTSLCSKSVRCRWFSGPT